jgi:hypothetical protein
MNWMMRGDSELEAGETARRLAVRLACAWRSRSVGHSCRSASAQEGPPLLILPIALTSLHSLESGCGPRIPGPISITVCRLRDD